MPVIGNPQMTYPSVVQYMQDHGLCGMHPAQVSAPQLFAVASSPALVASAPPMAAAVAAVPMAPAAAAAALPTCQIGLETLVQFMVYV